VIAATGERDPAFPSWATADVHAFWNEHERHVGTSLYGRGMYETMRVWERDDWLTTEPAVVPDHPPARRAVTRSAADEVMLQRASRCAASGGVPLLGGESPECGPGRTLLEQGQDVLAVLMALREFIAYVRPPGSDHRKNQPPTLRE